MQTQPMQHAAVDRVFLDPGVVGIYALQRDMPPGEGAALLHFQPAFAGRDVLDMGVGAGRTTRFLASLARRYECFDYAPSMVAWMRRHMPGISVRQCDARELAPYADASFDFALASNCLFDAFDPADRQRSLNEAARVLRPGGLLVFTAHNLRFHDARTRPSVAWSRNPARTALSIWRWWRAMRNFRRLAPHQVHGSEHAVLVSPAHEFNLLLHFIDPAAQQRQLADAGFELLDVFDADGRQADLHQAAAEHSAWVYVARKRPA